MHHSLRYSCDCMPCNVYACRNWVTRLVAWWEPCAQVLGHEGPILGSAWECILCNRYISCVCVHAGMWCVCTFVCMCMHLHICLYVFACVILEMELVFLAHPDNRPLINCLALLCAIRLANYVAWSTIECILFTVFTGTAPTTAPSCTPAPQPSNATPPSLLRLYFFIAVGTAGLFAFLFLLAAITVLVLVCAVVAVSRRNRKSIATHATELELTQQGESLHVRSRKQAAGFLILIVQPFVKLYVRMCVYIP